MILANKLEVTDSGLTAAKILAVVCMACDHVNKYLLNNNEVALFSLGRLALPLFLLVLCVNLARPSMGAPGFRKVASRLVTFGLISSLPFTLLGGLSWGWWPLNILFTLALITAVVGLVESGNWFHRGLGISAGIFGGALVEYWWPAVLIGVGLVLALRRNNPLYLAMAAFGFAGLIQINGNLWALVALPVFFVICRVDWRLPRFKWGFYWFYPLHLAAIFALQVYLEAEGYLFFYRGAT